MPTDIIDIQKALQYTSHVTLAKAHLIQVIAEKARDPVMHVQSV